MAEQFKKIKRVFRTIDELMDKRESTRYGFTPRQWQNSNPSQSLRNWVSLHLKNPDGHDAYEKPFESTTITFRKYPKRKGLLYRKFRMHKGYDMKDQDVFIADMPSKYTEEDRAENIKKSNIEL